MNKPSKSVELRKENYKGWEIYFNPLTGSALLYKDGAFVKAFTSDMAIINGKPVKTDNAIDKAKEFINTPF